MRLVANSANSSYLRAALDSISTAPCSQVLAAVAYVTWADDLLAFCRSRELPFSLYCLCNWEVIPNPGVVQAFLDRAGHWNLRLTADHFHPKLIWFRDVGLYIGSANLSRPAWYKNIEAGVFFDRDELDRLALSAELATFFNVIESRSRPATREDLQAITRFSPRLRDLDNAKRQLAADFRRTFMAVPGSDAPPAVNIQADPAKDAFVREWANGLELLRNAQGQLRAVQEPLGRRWVTSNIPLAVEVDQALNYFYTQRISGTEDLAHQAVERLHHVNQAHPLRSLGDALRAWMHDPIPDWIQEIVVQWTPTLHHLLTEDSLSHLTLEDWVQICTYTHAIRMTARQLSNVVLGRPTGTHVDMEQRIRWYAQYTWDRRTAAGRTIGDVVLFLIWNDRLQAPERIWQVVRSPDWKIERFGISAAGELLGMGRPNEFPPRNNRVSRALYALGFNIERYGG